MSFAKQLSNKDSANVATVHEAAKAWAALPADPVATSRKQLGERFEGSIAWTACTPCLQRTNMSRSLLVRAGMIVRQAGPFWIHGLVLAAVLDTPSAAAANAAGAAPVLDEDGGDTAEVAWDAAAAATRYAALAHRVRDLGLVGVWNLRPLLDVRHIILDDIRLTFLVLTDQPCAVYVVIPSRVRRWRQG